MLKILTALDNPELNKKLKLIKDFNISLKDIQYREGIIDVLKKENNFDVLIIYEKLLGEISLEELIKNIKNINNKINIIFVLENKNEKLENKLKLLNIKNIFYNNEINFNEFIDKIKNLKLSDEELLKNEIKNLKNIISEKNDELLKYKENNNLNKKSEKIIFVFNSEIKELKKYKKIINLFENKNINININILFIEESKKDTNIKILKNIFKKYNIIGKIKYKKNNIKLNKKIIKKIEE